MISFDENGHCIKDNITKDENRIDLFRYVNTKFIEVIEYAKYDKIKLTKQNLRMCVWRFFQRYKLILNDYKINLNMEDENDYLDEYFKLKELNLKIKKYVFDY